MNNDPLTMYILNKAQLGLLATARCFKTAEAFASACKSIFIGAKAKPSATCQLGSFGSSAALLNIYSRWRAFKIEL